MHSKRAQARKTPTRVGSERGRHPGCSAVWCAAPCMQACNHSRQGRRFAAPLPTCHVLAELGKAARVAASLQILGLRSQPGRLPGAAGPATQPFLPLCAHLAAARAYLAVLGTSRCRPAPAPSKGLQTASGYCRESIQEGWLSAAAAASPGPGAARTCSAELHRSAARR